MNRHRCEETDTEMKLRPATESAHSGGLEPPTPQRSRIMAAIRSTGNQSTELALARLLRSHRICGWRRHLSLPGRPDYVFKLQRLAVFVDGCFWHGCPRCYKQPTKNTQFWREKVRSNRERDRTVDRKLRAEGWAVLRIWEHSLSHRAGIGVIQRVTRALNESGRKHSGR
jgi:DNA mismatch endonuclease, patch repair protein